MCVNRPLIILAHHKICIKKGRAINQHPGNRNFRAMVAEQKPFFTSALKRKTKQRIAKEIINKIYRSGGRFLAEDPDGTIGDEENEPDLPEGIHPSLLSKAWTSVDFDKVLVKVMHRLREKDQNKVDENKEQKVLTSKKKAAVVSNSQKIISQEYPNASEDITGTSDSEEKCAGESKLLKVTLQVKAKRKTIL